MTGGVCNRNKKSGLVLDMSQNEVTLQHYNGSPSQLWDLEGFLIRSKQNGYIFECNFNEEKIKVFRLNYMN
jgi:hypothetical protein